MIKTTFIFLGLAFGLLLAWQGLKLAGEHVGAARTKAVRLPPGSIPIPHERTHPWRTTSDLCDRILRHWAERELPDWQTEGKVTAPRVLLGKFALKQDLAEANAYLLHQRPRGNSGSRWALHPEGDYDFTLAGLTLILYLFGEKPDILFPETREHLLSVLLTEEGGKPKVSVPRTLGLVRDTENHLLMTEGSRYLKNRWMWLHGATERRYDNERNGLERWLLSFLDELNGAGLYEFNSMPYLGYTMTALMNLEAFGSERIRRAARDLLDQLNWKYALGSLRLRRFAPFRRQLRKAGITALDKDYHTALMTVWMSFKEDTTLDLNLEHGFHHALWACLLPYRLPDEVARWIEHKPHPYFVRMGHGPNASPEIYSGGPGYLISAGGVHRGKRSMIVARPITLMLEDGARDLSGVIHLAGPGSEFTQWNNTGVYRDFACAAGPVVVPEGWIPTASNAIWRVYRVPRAELTVAVHSRPELGILCLFHRGDAEAILRELGRANPDPEVLNHAFQWPGGERITYDVHAPKNRWVMISAGDKVLDRDFDHWPRIEGNLSLSP